MTKWITSLVLTGDSAEQKLREDIVKIAQRMGYQPLYIFPYKWDDESEESLKGRVDGLTPAVARGDLVLHLIPSRNSLRFTQRFIKTLKVRGAHLAIGIIDSEYLRYPENIRKQHEVFEKEPALFNEAEALLVHSPEMEEALKKAGVARPMFQRGPFDYLINMENLNLTSELKREICFVGTPSKSDFLQHWDCETPLRGFFPEFEKDYPAKNVEIMGHENYLERIPRDSFGIFWESGWNFKEYSKYTMPIKCSMYLTLGMPIIAWSGSAFAKFIEKEGVGFVVDEIDEIDQKLKALTDSDLKEMKKRTNALSYKVRSGFYTENTLAQLEQAIFNDVWTV